MRRNAGRETPIAHDTHGLRLALQQALRRQHMGDLGGADAEGKRAKGAVRRRVAVAADNRHAGLSEAELRSHHVHDAAVGAVPA